MHPYSTDSAERKQVTFYLALISIVVSIFLPKLSSRLGIPPFLFHVSGMALFGVLWTLFNGWIWKTWVLQKTLVRVPNLKGKWVGQLTTSHDDHSEERSVTIQIQQSWTAISIRFSNDQSKSQSLNASIMVGNRDAVVLSYEYINEPNYDAVDSMKMHRGFTRFELSPDHSCLTGQYFTGRERHSFGTLRFHKVHENLSNTSSVSKF